MEPKLGKLLNNGKDNTFLGDLAFYLKWIEKMIKGKVFQVDNIDIILVKKILFQEQVCKIWGQIWSQKLTLKLTVKGTFVKVCSSYDRESGK